MNGKILALMDSSGMLTGVGRAHMAAVATVKNGSITSWDEIEVGWDITHESEAEGMHHANVAKFIQAHSVEMIVAAGAGPDMQRMLEKLGTKISLAAGAARDAVESIAAKD